MPEKVVRLSNIGKGFALDPVAKKINVSPSSDAGNALVLGADDLLLVPPSVTHYLSVYDNGVHQANYNSDGASAGAGAMAVGPRATAVAQSAVAVGELAAANGLVAVSLGFRATAFSDSTVALGPTTTVVGLGAIAIGSEARTAGADAIALGRYAYASNPQAVAIGAKSTTTRANEVSVGTTVAPAATRLIANVTDPLLPQDAATKKYVDQLDTKLVAAGAYPVAATDRVLIHTSAAATWTLPAANATNKGRVIALINHGTGSVTLSQPVRTANATTTSTVAVAMQLQIISDGAQWRRISL